MSLMESSLPAHSTVVTKIFGHGGNNGLSAVVGTMPSLCLEEVFDGI